MAGALRVEVGRQVLVGVAVAVRRPPPRSPCSAAGRAGLRGANLVGDAVDARAPLRVRSTTASRHNGADHAVQWHVLLDGIGAHRVSA